MKCNWCKKESNTGYTLVENHGFLCNGCEKKWSDTLIGQLTGVKKAAAVLERRISEHIFKMLEGKQ